MPKTTPHRRGFTLIELVVVILILALAAGIAVPTFGKSIGRYRTRAAAFQAAELLNAARDRARITSSTVHVRFETVTDTYSVSDDGSGEPRTVSTTDEHSGVTISWAVFIHNAGASMTGLAFDHTGAPLVGNTSIGETLHPLSSATIGFVQGNHTVQLTVDKVTGLAEVVP